MKSGTQWLESLERFLIQKQKDHTRWTTASRPYRGTSDHTDINRGLILVPSDRKPAPKHQSVSDCPSPATRHNALTDSKSLRDTHAHTQTHTHTHLKKRAIDDIKMNATTIAGAVNQAGCYGNWQIVCLFPCIFFFSEDNDEQMIC